MFGPTHRNTRETSLKLIALLIVTLGLASMLAVQLGLFPGGASLSTLEGKEAASNVFFGLAVAVSVAWLMFRASGRKGGKK